MDVSTFFEVAGYLTLFVFVWRFSYCFFADLIENVENKMVERSLRKKAASPLVNRNERPEE